MLYTNGETTFSAHGYSSEYRQLDMKFDSYEKMKSITELSFKSLMGNADLNMYRIYTPGHWEDADGNWINGSWSDKDTNQWIPIDCESFFAYWTDNVMGEHYDSFRWSVSVNGTSPQEPGN